MEAIIILVVVQQTQPLNENVWLNVPFVGIVEQPLVQWNIPIPSIHPTIEIASSCANC
jgi:hypothetical protein